MTENQSGTGNNPPTDSKRSECRLANACTVFVETWSAPQGDVQPANLVITKSIDISANGIQIALDHSLTLQSVLRLCLESGDEELPFMLIGEVAWLRPQEKQTLTGLRLLESDDTDIIRWKEYIARCLLAE